MSIEDYLKIKWSCTFDKNDTYGDKVETLDEKKRRTQVEQPETGSDANAAAD